MIERSACKCAFCDKDSRWQEVSSITYCYCDEHKPSRYCTEFKGFIVTDFVHKIGDNGLEYKCMICNLCRCSKCGKNAGEHDDNICTKPGRPQGPAICGGLPAPSIMSPEQMHNYYRDCPHGVGAFHS